MNRLDTPTDAEILAVYQAAERNLGPGRDAVDYTSARLAVSEDRVREVVRADAINFGG